jgi:hypothetical protein
METLKQEIVMALSKLPETADINDIKTTVNGVVQQVSTNNETMSFLEAAKDYVGCVKNAPKDLSINKAYFYG